MQMTTLVRDHRPIPGSVPIVFCPIIGVCFFLGWGIYNCISVELSVSLDLSEYLDIPAGHIGNVMPGQAGLLYQRPWYCTGC